MSEVQLTPLMSAMATYSEDIKNMVVNTVISIFSLTIFCINTVGGKKEEGMLFQVCHILNHCLL